MIEWILKTFANQQCPSCQTRQPILVLFGVRWRVRKPHMVVDCPGCKRLARLAYSRSCSFEVLLVITGIICFVIALTGVTSFIIPYIGQISEVRHGFIVVALGCTLLLVVTAILGLSLRYSRRVINDGF